MERKEFFSMAQKATVLTGGFVDLPKEPIEEITVECNGVEYYPRALKVWFDVKGNVKNTAVLHDLHQKSETYARLEKISKRQKETSDKRKPTPAENPERK